MAFDESSNTVTTVICGSRALRRYESLLVLSADLFIFAVWKFEATNEFKSANQMREVVEQNESKPT
jgi:hypothetical protein